MTVTTAQIEPLTGSVGARVLDVDLRRLDDTMWTELRNAWYRHKVLFFPGQSLEHHALRDFALRFGKLEQHEYAPEANADSLIPQPVSADCSEVVEVTERARADAWHTDHSFYKRPSKATVFQYAHGPSGGGDTMWGNLQAAYDALSEPLKEMLRGLTAQHTGASVLLGQKSAVHPVVRQHPVTKRPGLYVNRSNTSHIRELRRAESNALLRMLFDHCEQPRFTCRWHWQPGDLVVWDNRVTIHHAVNDYSPDEVRVAHRAVVTGDHPTTDVEPRWPDLEAAPTYLSAGVDLFMSGPS